MAKRKKYEVPEEDEDLLGQTEGHGEEGHNSGTRNVGGVAGDRLRAYLDRIERLEDEKKALSADIKDIYAEAKSFGFDTKTLRKCYRLRLMNTEKRREEDELLELYKAAIGLD